MRRRSINLALGVTFGTILLSIGGAGSAAARTPDSWSDFDDDGYTDLAIGVPRATVLGLASAGAVIVLYGGPGGLSGTGSQHWNANNSLDAADDAQLGARFGSSLAAGDFDRDGYGDLAVGAPGWGVGEQASTGKVYVLFGSAAGLSSAGSKTWKLTGTGTKYADAGYALAALDWFDFDGPNDKGDGFADLAVGAPRWNGAQGRVTIIAGQWFADLPNGNTTSFYGNGTQQMFGRALAAGDFNDTLPGPGAGQDDLAIGAPLQHAGDISHAGMVVVKQRGSSGSVQTKTYTQDTGSIADHSEVRDYSAAFLQRVT